MFACQECGRKFKTAAATERAISNGCPKCGGTDIDLTNNVRQFQNSQYPVYSGPLEPRVDSLHPEGL